MTLTRRQIITGAAAFPALGLPALPVVDPIGREADRILALAEALVRLPMSAEHAKWAKTIRNLAEPVPAAASGARDREWRETISPLMSYSEFLGLHHPANSAVSRLTKEITAAIIRMDELPAARA